LSLVTVFFDVQKFFSFMQSHLFIISLRIWAYWVLLRKLFPTLICSSVCSAASWSCCKVLGLILRSLICFEFILVQGERQGYSLSLLHVDIQFSQQHLLKSCLISIMCFVLLCYRWVGLCLDGQLWSIGIPISFCAQYHAVFIVMGL
jgi:hypothetical protein